MAAADGLVLTSLSLTHVQFDENDLVAYALAYITLCPIAIMVFYASVIVSRREVAMSLMLVGQLANEVLNTILKEYFQISRPYDHLGSGYGMPSSHSQFVWIYLGYHTLEQVLVGSLVGVVFGTIWYSSMEQLRKQGWVDWLLSTRLASLVYLRDMRHIDNVLEWEHQQWIASKSKKSQ
ncbi:hypothetical protein DM01DRAFT_1365180 [Hesseltinella vesiculosa]|uniref:Dolichyldiphosphatase n=1 Tax=Hesseltinella vesiculosa TaxID=101127 RepID=A0A1X2GXV3_9FUNG|nr:hypothetical protein DM01DRAFT_1365180 [Hesseltinella vesiculosa]